MNPTRMPYLNNSYYFQDLLQRPLHAASRPRFAAAVVPAYRTGIGARMTTFNFSSLQIR